MKGEKVDQLFHNASIICLDEKNQTGEAMAIKNGKIIEIGPERQILNKYRSEETFDLEGREVFPVFSDGDLHIDTNKQWNSVFLEEIETQELEQGILEVFVHGISNKKLIELEKFASKMEIVWHVYLTPSKQNLTYIRMLKKRRKNSNLVVAGFTIANENESTVLEACSISKSKSLQIGLNCTHGQKHLPLIIQSLQNHTLDHRWFVFNIKQIDAKMIHLLETNNIFLCVNSTNKLTFPIYIFGTNYSSNKLLENVSNYSKLNQLEFFSTLKSITNWAQYLSFSEKTNGTLEKGKNANFTILAAPINLQNENTYTYAQSCYWKGKQIYSME